jgi:phosphoesterase RecJ-like protein
MPMEMRSEPCWESRARCARLAHPDEDPVPAELAFLLDPSERIAHDPELGPGVTLVAVDCASPGRLWADSRHEQAEILVNIDHHQDNPGFGDINLIEPHASSSAEVAIHVLDAAEWPIDRAVAEPLYVGLVTDTGRFSYANTGPEAHRIAARLLDAGARGELLSRLLYEEQPIERLALLGRALARAERRADGRLMLAALNADDFEAAGGRDAEGAVELMRSAQGVEVAALVREADGSGGLRVSLRSQTGDVDVSSIARVYGGGGHRAAAGFSAPGPPNALLDHITDLVVAQLDG